MFRPRSDGDFGESLIGRRLLDVCCSWSPYFIKHHNKTGLSFEAAAHTKAKL